MLGDMEGKAVIDLCCCAEEVLAVVDAVGLRDGELGVTVGNQEGLIEGTVEGVRVGTTEGFNEVGEEDDGSIVGSGVADKHKGVLVIVRCTFFTRWIGYGPGPKPCEHKINKSSLPCAFTAIVTAGEFWP